MAKDPYGNELGIKDGTTTFDGETIVEWQARGALPKGYYVDPEGTLRSEMLGFNGKLPNQGGRHATAIYVDGRVVSFEYPGLPDSAGSTAQFGPQMDAYHDPKCIVAGIAANVPGDLGTFYNYVVGDDWGKPSGGKVDLAPTSAAFKLAQIAAIVAS